MLSTSRISRIINECIVNHLNNVLLFERTEGLYNDSKFKKWKELFDSYLYEMLNELNVDYLTVLGLRVVIDSDYVFNGGKSRWLAVYERSSGKIGDGIITIGINYPHFYSEMVKRRISNDRFNIEAQARITVGHEIGHGLVDYVKNLDLNKSVLGKYSNLSVIVRCGGNKEERIVEEFGEYLFPDATGVWRP